MKKVTDFNNTYMENTKLHREMISSISGLVDINESFWESSKYITIYEDMSVGFRDIICNYEKQIHLVNNEWYYVEDCICSDEELKEYGCLCKGVETRKKPKNNFEEYGFSGDFEGEILKEIGGIYIGYYIDDNIIYSCSWIASTGECSIDKNFNLTPIKKPWYKTFEGQILKQNTISFLEKMEDENVKDALDYLKSLSNTYTETF